MNNNQISSITLTEKDAARYIGMSCSFLRQDRMKRQLAKPTSGPQYLKLGRSVRYLKDDLDQWLLRHRKNFN